MLFSGGSGAPRCSWWSCANQVPPVLGVNTGRSAVCEFPNGSQTPFFDANAANFLRTPRCKCGTTAVREAIQGGLEAVVADGGYSDQMALFVAGSLLPDRWCLPCPPACRRHSTVPLCPEVCPPSVLLVNPLLKQRRCTQLCMQDLSIWCKVGAFVLC